MIEPQGFLAVTHLIRKAHTTFKCHIEQVFLLLFEGVAAFSRKFTKLFHSVFFILSQPIPLEFYKFLLDIATKQIFYVSHSLFYFVRFSSLNIEFTF